MGGSDLWSNTLLLDHGGAPQIYHKKVYEIFEGISNVDTSADDIIVWGRNREEHDEALQEVL